MVDKDRLARLEDKIDKITEKLSDINSTMAENTQSLIIHEKRTDIAEKKLSLLELEFKEKSVKDNIILAQIEEKLNPVHTHVIIINTTIKFILPAIAGTLAFLYKFNVFKF